MTIKQSQADLRAAKDDGLRPDARPRFGPTLAKAWKQANEENEILAMAHSGVLLRASDAGNCARALGYKVRRRYNGALNELLALGHEDGGYDESLALPVDEYSNPPTLADTYRMGIGSMVHEAIQGVLPAAFPGAEVEVKILRVTNGDEPGISMHADVLLTWEDEHDEGEGAEAVAVMHERKVLIEIKTINGVGFKRAVGADRGGATGPRQNAIVQGALAAYEVRADQLVIMYLALECLSPAVASRYGFDDIGRFCAEWTFEEDEIHAIATAEHKRMQAIVGLVEQGVLPPRSIPDPELPAGHRVVNPKTGGWEVRRDGQLLNVGETWHCAYCWDQDRCIADLKAGD